MANVDRQAGELADTAGETEEHAEEQIAQQRAIVFIKIATQARTSARCKPLQPGMSDDALGQQKVAHLVVVITRDQAGEKQPDTRNGCKPECTAGEWVQFLKQSGRFRRIDNGGREQLGPGPCDDDGNGNRQQDVAKNGDVLGSHHVAHQLGELSQFARAGVLKSCGQRGGGHRRLLGGHYATQHVDQRKAKSVVESIDQPLGQRRQVQQ